MSACVKETSPALIDSDVICMVEAFIARRLLYGQLVHSKRHQGWLKKRSKDSVNADVHWCIIHPKQLEKYPRDRPCWELQFNKLPPTVRRTCAKHTTVQHRQPHNHNHWLPMVLLFQTTCCETEAAEPHHSSQTNHINDRKENCIHTNE